MFLQWLVIAEPLLKFFTQKRNIVVRQTVRVQTYEQKHVLLSVSLIIDRIYHLAA